MIKTADFNPEIDTKLLCTCGHELCDKRSVSQEHLNRVQIARTIDGNAWSVTSVTVLHAAILSMLGLSRDVMPLVLLKLLCI